MTGKLCNAANDCYPEGFSNEHVSFGLTPAICSPQAELWLSYEIVPK